MVSILPMLTLTGSGASSLRDFSNKGMSRSGTVNWTLMGSSWVMVTIAPVVEVAVELVDDTTTLLACTKDPGNTLIMPARPSIGERR